MEINNPTLRPARSREPPKRSRDFITYEDDETGDESPVEEFSDSELQLLDVPNQVPEEPEVRPESRNENSNTPTQLEEAGFKHDFDIKAVDATLGNVPDIVEGKPILHRNVHTPLDIVQQYLDPQFVGHLVDQTEQYMAAHPEHILISQPRPRFTADDFWNFFSLYFSLTIVNYQQIADAWVREADPSDNLLGNDFYRNTMSRDWFFTIHRCLQASIPDVTNWFNTTSARIWCLGTRICFDDQLDKFLGYGGGAKHVPKKQARNGVASWEITDSKHFCGYILWESMFPDTDATALNVMQMLLSRLDHKKQQHIIYIDAGLLGGYSTANQIVQAKHRFLMSCTANRSSWIFKDFLHRENIAVCDTAVIGRPSKDGHNDGMVAITYQSQLSKQSKRKGKLVNFLTNLPGMWRPECGCSNRDVSAKRTSFKKIRGIFEYNRHHGYVDTRKSQLSRIDHEHRSSRAWKHKLFAIFRSILLNSSIIWRARAPVSQDKRTLRAFMLNLVHSCRKRKDLPQLQDPVKPEFHTLTSTKRATSRCCYPNCGLHTSWVCYHCAPLPNGKPVALCGRPDRSCNFNWHTGVRTPHLEKQKSCNQTEIGV